MTNESNEQKNNSEKISIQEPVRVKGMHMSDDGGPKTVPLSRCSPTLAPQASLDAHEIIFDSVTEKIRYDKFSAECGHAENETESNDEIRDH